MADRPSHDHSDSEPDSIEQGLRPSAYGEVDPQRGVNGSGGKRPTVSSSDHDTNRPLPGAEPGSPPSSSSTRDDDTPARKKPWWNRVGPGVVTIILAPIFVGVGIWLATHFLSHVFKSTPRSASANSAASARNPDISVGTKGSFYRIFLPVYNSLHSDQQLKQISVTMTFPGSIGCAEVPPIAYRLQDTIAVKRAAGSARPTVVGESGAVSGVHVPATGEWHGGCGAIQQIYFRFLPAALVLKKVSTTTVAIDIPRRLHVTYDAAVGDGGRLYLRHKDHYEQVVPDIRSLGHISFRVTASTSGGEEINSCLILRGGQPAEQRPLRKCKAVTTFYYEH
jgi:hypothetical protein